MAVIHDMERYLSPQGTIATITPPIGLLGTVVGMIEVFAVIVSADGASRTAEQAQRHGLVVEADAPAVPADVVRALDQAGALGIRQVRIATRNIQPSSTQAETP